MARVLLGCSPPETLGEVREALEAAGNTVTQEEHAEAILKAARGGAYALVVVGEALEGGTGSDLCGVLDGLAGRTRLLYVGPEPQAGADASVPPEEIFGIVEQALRLLELAARSAPPLRAQEAAGATPIEISGESSLGRAVEKQLGWAAPATPIEKVSARVRPPQPSQGKARVPVNGGPRTNGASGDRLQAMLRKAREADYFEILGVGEEASDSQIREAYAEQRRALLAMARESANRPVVEEIQGILEDALEVLGDPALRDAYARNRGRSPDV